MPFQKITRAYNPPGVGALQADIVRRDAELVRSINSLAETTWEDLRMPAQSINPAGSTAPPSVDNATGMLSFAGNADNIIAGVAQMPHGWKHGSAIRCHLHLIFPTTASAKDTRWKLEYNRSNVNGNFEHAYGTYTAMTVITVRNPAATAKQVVASFAELDMTGYIGSTCLLWRITRLASSDAADNDTAACILAEFDIHYQKDRNGSLTEIPT